MSDWRKIDSALDAELENFDRFMTGQDIQGDNSSKFNGDEIGKIERILEHPLPDKFIQEELLKLHSRKG